MLGHDPSPVTGTEDSLEIIRKKVEEIVSTMYQAAGWGQPNFDWPRNVKSKELVVQFPANAAGVQTDKFNDAS